MKDLKSAFGGETRAVDGCITTFQLPDGTIVTERFNQVLHTKMKGKAGRKTIRSGGGTYLEQTVARADELGAKILCISTPQTILTDLQGDRSMKKQHTESPFPEPHMLGRLGRTDLFKPPHTSLQPRQNIRQVSQLRSDRRNRTLS